MENNRDITADFERISEIISGLRARKKEVDAVIENPAFRDSFFEAFSLGSFSALSTAVENDQHNFRVRIEPYQGREQHPDEWRVTFFVRASTVLYDDHVKVWRPAKVGEILSNWDSFSPLLAKALKEDRKNLVSVEKTIDRLRDLLAGPIVARAIGAEDAIVRGPGR